jgi:lipid A ethanolaminephosphotransferase
LPSIYIIKAQLKKDTGKRFLLTASLTLAFIAILAFVNSSNWLWIDKHSKTLGGLAMPWSYSVNASLYYVHQYQENKKEILLPNATIKDNQKSIMVLVIGESSRSKNFSLYGYSKNTNPLLSQTKNLTHLKAASCATYTTAGLKCILEHARTDDLYEILPNYLYRNNVEVIWRSTNWGEPPIHIKNFLNKNALKQIGKGENGDYDEALLNGLKEQILSSKSHKILIVLHTSTSHGPAYSQKYPPAFEKFKPVCNSVELGKCSSEELINAYDNTIVYTDYLLSRVIEDLKQIPEYNSAMLFVSDHGESLGEKNLYMHGMPMSLAPAEQYDIPFLVWLSDNNHKQLKPITEATQSHVFHSVLSFLGVESQIYNEEFNIFTNGVSR